MAKYSIKDLPLTKLDKMNQDHEVFINILNSLFDMICESDKNNEREVDAELNHIYEHTVEHFQMEEDLMRRANFPPYEIHKGEHDRVLKMLNDSIIDWKLNRNRKIIKNLVNSILPDWLIQHITTMDTVTAQFIESSKSHQVV